MDKIKEEEEEEIIEKKVVDIVQRYMESQKELMEMVVDLFKRLDNPLLKKLLE